jgi:hypothetical protein
VEVNVLATAACGQGDSMTISFTQIINVMVRTLDLEPKDAYFGFSLFISPFRK